MRREARKDLNLLLAYRQMGAVKQRKTGVKNGAVIFLIVAAFLIAGLLYLKIRYDNRLLEEQIYRVEQQLLLPVYAEQEAELESTAQALSEISDYNRVLLQHQAALEVHYRPDSSLFRRIEAAGVPFGVRFSSLDYLDETVTLYCTTADASDAAAYAKALENGILDDVVFTGYLLENYSALSGAEDAPESIYGFTVTGVREGE